MSGVCGGSTDIDTSIACSVNPSMAAHATAPAPSAPSSHHRRPHTFDWQRHVGPSASIKAELGKELAISLPRGAVSRFGTLFAELEDCRDSLLVSSYGCSIAKLEEVFLKVGEGSVDDGATTIDIRSRIGSRRARRDDAAVLARRSINAVTDGRYDDGDDGDDSLLIPLNGSIPAAAPATTAVVVAAVPQLSCRGTPAAGCCCSSSARCLSSVSGTHRGQSSRHASS